MKHTEPATVLVVDDEADLCEMLVFEFSAKGHQVFSAMDGQEAMRILSQETISLLVTDVRMPHCSGLELLSWVKARNVWQPAVVLISAYADITLDEAYALGAEVLLTKPFRLATLADMVNRILLSPDRRWSIPPDILPLQTISLHFPNLTEAQHRGALDIGRGGIAFSASGPPLMLGERIGFSVQFEEGPFPALNGSGTVCWTRVNTHPEHPYACGVEFDWLKDDCRDAFLEWHSRQSLRPYIPLLRNR